MKRIATYAVAALVIITLSCRDKNIDTGLELLEKNETELAMLRFTNAANKNPGSVAAQYYSAFSLILNEDFAKAQEYGDKLAALHAEMKKAKYKYGITGNMIEALGLLLAVKNGHDSLYSKPRTDLLPELEALRDHPAELINTAAASILGSWMLKWTFEATGRIMSPPMVTKEKVAVSTGDGMVFCVHPEDGTFLWSYDGGGHAYFNNGPFMAEGRMFAVCFDTLYEMDPDKGTHKARYPDVSTRPAIEGNDAYAVYSPSLVRPDQIPYYVIKKMRLGGKKPVWQYRVDGEFSFTTPLISGNNMYVQATDNFYCFNKNTGKIVWTFKIHTGSFPQSPALEGDNVVFGADKVLYCLNAATGAVKWKYQAGGNIESTPVIDGEMIYFGNNDARVYAVGLADGKKMWRYKTYGGITATPAVGADCVYAASGDGNLYALDRTTGAIRWKYPLGDACISSPQLMDGTVFVGSNDKILFALREKLVP